MSTKTTFKRIALVAVAALGLGMLSAFTPANAQVNTGLVASVGPNGETSLTVVGSTPAALVRLTLQATTHKTLALQLTNQSQLLLLVFQLQLQLRLLLQMADQWLIQLQLGPQLVEQLEQDQT